ncbi:MAG: electron transport complex subunit RsxC, partial [Candidatus Subteraquimicrobiales bacterium]|nr:electron transport complex subunit RsxC [Candidatus Subteraquimicrobiales bacterium]
EMKFEPARGELTPEKIKTAVREAGLVGLGGAAFPTHVKLSPPKEKPINTIIINGSECEPYITCDKQNMLERTDELIDGCKLIMQATQAKRAFIGIEMNKLEAIDNVLKAISSEKDIQVVKLDTKYPQGAEKHLIKTVLSKEVPSGGLPMDVGTIVQNVGTTIAISEAVRKGKPLIERCLTVSGTGVKNPKNLRVKIGTPIGHLIEECGGFKDEIGKIIMGGPMTGHAQFSLDVPVVKGTSGVIVFTEDEVRVANPRACFRCGRCVKACPVFLMPNFIGTYIEAGLIDKVKALLVMDCFECGLCAYICPAERPLVQLIRHAKSKILNQKKKG